MSQYSLHQGGWLRTGLLCVAREDVVEPEALLGFLELEVQHVVTTRSGGCIRFCLCNAQLRLFFGLTLRLTGGRTRTATRTRAANGDGGGRLGLAGLLGIERGFTGSSSMMMAKRNC